MTHPGVTIRRKPAEPGKPLAFIQFTQAVTLEGTSFPVTRVLDNGVLEGDVIRIGADVFPLVSGVIGQYRLK